MSFTCCLSYLKGCGFQNITCLVCGTSEVIVPSTRRNRVKFTGAMFTRTKGPSVTREEGVVLGKS